MKKSFFLLVVIALLLITGCGKKEYEPVAINEKTDKCATCNMAVKDDQYATEMILENGKTLVFDDIGCMNKWIEENEDQKVAASFVRDFNSKEWAEMEKATYVYGKSIKTPMAYNMISFINKKDAESFIAENDGELLTYEELNDHIWERNKEMMEKMKMHMHNENGEESSTEHNGEEGMDMNKSEHSK